MYCKNCGTQYLTEEAVMCVRCGAPKGAGKNFCYRCGQPTNPQSMVCLKCGVALDGVASPDSKSKLTAGLLGIFLGCWGVHNFYLGYTTKAVIQLVCSIVGLILSCFFVGIFVVAGIEIWGLVEGIMILCGKINVDGKGHPLKD